VVFLKNNAHNQQCLIFSTILTDGQIKQPLKSYYDNKINNFSTSTKVTISPVIFPSFALPKFTKKNL